MLDTWGQIMTLAAILTFLSLRWNNILLSLGASMAWLSLMAYNLNSPPPGIVQGSTIHEWMTMGFIIVAIAVLFMWFRNRGRSESVTRVSADEDGLVARTTKLEGRGLMDLPEEEYRAYARSRLRRRRQ